MGVTDRDRRTRRGDARPAGAPVVPCRRRRRRAPDAGTYDGPRPAPGDDRGRHRDYARDHPGHHGGADGDAGPADQPARRGSGRRTRTRARPRRRRPAPARPRPPGCSPNDSATSPTRRCRSTPDGMVHPHPKPLSVIIDPERPARQGAAVARRPRPPAHPRHRHGWRGSWCCAAAYPTRGGWCCSSRWTACSSSSSSPRRSAELPDPLVTLLSADRRDAVASGPSSTTRSTTTSTTWSRLLADEHRPRGPTPSHRQHPGTSKNRGTGRDGRRRAVADCRGSDAIELGDELPRAARLRGPCASTDLMATLWLELATPRTRRPSSSTPHSAARRPPRRARPGREGRRESWSNEGSWPGERWHDRAVTSLALVLAPLTCGAGAAASAVPRRWADPAATRDAFICDGRALARSAARRWSRRCRTSSSRSACSCWSPGRWPLAVVAAVAHGPVRRVLGARRSACSGAARRSTAAASEPWATTGSRGTTLARNSLLVVLAALATAFGAAGSGVLPGAARLRDRGLVVARARGRGGGDRGPGGRGCAAPKPGRSDDGAARLRRASRSPSPCWRTRPATRTTLRQLAAQRPQLLVFLSSSCWAVRRRSPQGCPTGSRGSARSRSRRSSPSPLDSVPDEMRPAGVPRGSTSSRAPPTTFAGGRPSAVLLGADGAAGRRPVAGADAVAAFVEDILAELDAAQELSEAPHADGARPSVVLGTTRTRPRRQ